MKAYSKRWFTTSLAEGCRKTKLGVRGGRYLRARDRKRGEHRKKKEEWAVAPGGAVRAVGISSAVNVEVLTLCIVDNHVFGNGLMYNGN